MKDAVIIILLVAVALLALLTQTRNAPDSGMTPAPVLPKDTVWIRYDSVVTRTVVVKRVIHDSMVPGLNIDSLNLGSDTGYLVRRIYADTLLIPSIRGMFVINDTVFNNRLLSRTWQTSYSIPVTSTTVSKQMYIGTGFSLNNKSPVGLQLTILYKDSKERITGSYFVIDTKGKLSYGVQTYWKLRLKK